MKSLPQFPKPLNTIDEFDTHKQAVHHPGRPLTSSATGTLVLLFFVPGFVYPRSLSPVWPPDPPRFKAGWCQLYLADECQFYFSGCTKVQG
jgi:hypothetical protein